MTAREREEVIKALRRLRERARNRYRPVLSDITDGCGPVFDSVFQALENAGYYATPDTTRRRRSCVTRAIEAVKKMEVSP